MNKEASSSEGVNEALLALIAALEARDLFTKDHSIRVAHIVKLLTAKFRMSDTQKQTFYNAALLHDIGMVSIPDAILLKHGRLSSDERKLIQSSPEVAAKLVNMPPEVAADDFDLINQASQSKRRIVLPEGEEPRTIMAAYQCQQRGIAQCILLGDPERIHQAAASQGITLDDVCIINQADVCSNKTALNAGQSHLV